MQRFLSLITIAAVVVAFAAVNVIVARLGPVSSARLDLTEDGLYTLSPAGRSIARSPDEPVTLTLYFSESRSAGVPQLQAFGARVRETLESFASASRGRVRLELVDPEPFSEAEDEAIGEGLTGVPIDERGNPFFLGLVAENSTTGREVVPFFRPGPQAERFLEYDIAKIIYGLSDPARPTLGLLGGLPLDGELADPRLGRPPVPAWLVLQELEAAFEVERLIDGRPGTPEEADGPLTEVPASVDVLAVLHPESLSDEAVYAIDQFVLGGGRAVFFVDPNCEADPQPSLPSPFGGPPQGGGPTSSDLPRLFGAWGVTLRPGEVAGDEANATQVQIRTPRGPAVVPYPPYVVLSGDAIEGDDPITGRLGELFFASAGILERAEDAAAAWQPLVTTSAEGSAGIERFLVSQNPDPARIAEAFSPAGEPLVLAARLSGTVPSAFPDGPPNADIDADAEEAAGDTEAGDTAEGDEPTGPADDAASGHLAEGAIDVVIVADCDLLADRFWAESFNLLGRRVFQPVRDNAALLTNAAEVLSGSDALVSLRGRASSRRPLEKIDELERSADAAIREREAALEEEIAQAEQRITEILRAGGEGAGGELVIPDRVEAEVEALRAAIVDARRELRTVRLELNRDVERLKRMTVLANTAFVPAGLCLLAFTLAGVRTARKAIDRRRGLGRG